MSKVIALSASAMCSAGVVAGGYYLVKNGSGAGTEAKDNSSPNLFTSPLDEFKNSTVNDTDCIKDFAGLADLKEEGGQEISDSHQITKDFFNDQTGTAKGCLKMKWDKKVYSTPTDGWNGSLKLTGTFEKGNKGFISFLAARTKEKGKLSLVGLFYGLSKTDSVGSITHKKEISDDKEISKDTAATAFPQAGDKLTDLNSKPWWDMFSSEESIEKVCVEKDTECKEPSSSDARDKKGIWTGSTEDGAAQLDGWTKNLNNWWNNLYGSGVIAMQEISTSEKGQGSTSPS